MSANEAITLPIEVEERRITWKNRWHLWVPLYYGLGIIGLVASILAASLPEPSNRICAVISAICFGAIGFLRPQTRSFAYARAWRVLDIACMRYMRGMHDFQKLFDELERGENIISELLETNPDVVPANRSRG